jgi:single-stranded-DNA-specific exonuclease
LPPADALINPRLLTIAHPLANLSGVGVAYKLAEALLQSIPSPISALTLLDLAALGTVADLVPLIADNRYLVQTGLKTLRNTPRIGLQALFELAELNASNLNEEHIDFSIAPRLNALGRLEDANKAVELLTTGNLSRARILAIEIEGLNTRRKFLCDQVYEAAQNLILADRSKMDAGIIVLAHPDWPIGVLGIVASRLVSSYNRPAILISCSQSGLASGSARSIEGFNITAALAMNKDFLINFGGHPMAAGFSILPEKINEFIRAINYRSPSAIPARQEKRLLVDAELPLPMLSLELVQKLEMLAPFGPGNPQPLFVARDLNLVGCSEVGKNKEHLLLTIRGSTNETYKVISWQGAKRKLPEGQFELAYTCRSNNYLGKPGLQISLVDIRDQVKSDVWVTKTSVVVSVVDMRNSTPSQILDFYKTMQNEQALIWAEALRVSNLVSQNRLHLSLSPILAVWTIPPGPNELIQALKTVQPATIFLFGNDPGLDKMTPFLSRLAGLLKYALEYYQGSCDLRDLAAEMAHRIETVRCGLACLRALGHFQIIENNLILSLSTPGIINTADLPREQARLKTYLEETSAYRKYYLTADKSFLVTV